MTTEKDWRVLPGVHSKSVRTLSMSAIDHNLPGYRSA